MTDKYALWINCRNNEFWRRWCFRANEFHVLWFGSFVGFCGNNFTYNISKYLDRM